MKLGNLTKKFVSVVAAIAVTASILPKLPVAARREAIATSDVATAADAERADAELCQQSFELYPDDSNSDKVITLEGLMPEGAEAKANEVTSEYPESVLSDSVSRTDITETNSEENNTEATLEVSPESYGEGGVLAAYDIKIMDGSEEFQPGIENPILVEITDPVINGNIELWHVKDDGTREQIFDFTVEEGKVSFYAIGFSVYEIVDEGFYLDITYPVEPVSGDTSFSVISVDTDAVEPISDFTYVIKPKTYPKLIEKVTSVEQLETFDLTQTGFYLSGADAPGERNPGTGRFALGSVTDENRSGIIVTDRILDMNNKGVTDAAVNKQQLLYNAVETNSAVPFYFESTGIDNQYYIYCSPDDGVTKNYIKTKKNGNDYNALEYASGQSDATPYVIETGSADDSIKIRTANKLGNKYWYWNYRTDGEGPRFAGTDGSQYAGAGNNNIYIWYYALDHELTTDPYGLDGMTYGLVNNGYALTTVGNASNEIKGLQVTSGEGSYSSLYAITGWTFEWVEGTDTYKISAVTEDGAAKKYLQLATNGIHLVDESEASALTVTPNHNNGKIKLSLPQDNLSIYYDNKLFKKAGTDTVDANRYFDLVDVSEASTDALNLDNETYALINRNDSNGYALSAAINGTTNLKAQIVSARTNDAGKTEYVFLGDLSQWTFHHIDYNRYTISNGTQYLKLVNGSLTLSDESYILTVVAGSGDNEGRIKIYNSTDKAEIYRTTTPTFNSTTTINTDTNRWFDLAVVPDAPSEDVLGLDGKTYGIVGKNSNKYYAMLSEPNNADSNRLDCAQLNYNTELGEYEAINSVISGWTFHWMGRANYLVSDEDGKYIKLSSDSISLVTDPDEASVLTVELGTGTDKGKIKLTDINRSISCSPTFASAANGSFLDLVLISNQDDPYKLNGKTYALMNYSGGNTGNGFDVDSSGNPTSTELLSWIVRTKNDNNTVTTNTYYVAEDVDLSTWTFNSISEDNYSLSTIVGGATKYLHIDETTGTLSLSDTAQAIKVTPDNNKSIMLSVGDWAVTFQSGSGDDSDTFTGAAKGGSNQYLKFVDTSDLQNNDYVTYSAKKVSVSAGVNGTENGDEVLVYTRIWKEKTDTQDAHYEFFAVGGDGSLYPCYERGDNIMWVGGRIDTLLWEFVEYTYDDGTPNYYYELYNPYTQKYIAPKRAVNSSEQGQVLSDNKIGINLPGRKSGEYYTDILAWDDPSYSYSGLGALIDQSDNSITIPTNRHNADTFYFAKIIDPVTTLTEVETIDNKDYGITMRMVDWKQEGVSGGQKGKTQSVFLGSDVGGAVKTTDAGLLSTDLGNDGYPKTALEESRLTNYKDDYVQVYAYIDQYNAGG